MVTQVGAQVMHKVAAIRGRFLIGLIWFSAQSAWAMDVVLSDQQSPIVLTVQGIESAERTIQAVAYKFNNPAIYEALSKALKRGVQVTLIADADNADNKKSLVNAIEQRGARVIRWQENEMHAKFTIFDQRTVLAGSFNWTRAAGSKNMEIALQVSDAESVAAFLAAFQRLEHYGGKND